MTPSYCHACGAPQHATAVTPVAYERVHLVGLARQAVATGEFRRLVLRSGLTARDVALAVGCSPAAVQSWLSGRSLPTTRYAVALGRWLDHLIQEVKP
jgi:hypothetical protein